MDTQQKANDLDTNSDPDNESAELPYIDAGELSNYITRTVAILVGEAEESLISESLSIASRSLTTFIEDQQPSIFVVNRLTQHDDVSDKPSIRCTAINEMHYNKEQTVAVVFIKQGSAIVSDKPLCEQLEIHLLNKNDLYDSICGYIGSVLSPFFKSVVHGANRDDQESEKHISIIEKMLNDAEVALTHLKQNIEIPDAELTDELVEPNAKKAQTDQDDEDSCYFVYTFKNSQLKDLYIGHGTTKSSTCREFAALYPSKSDDKPAYQTIRQHLNSTGIYVFRAFTNLTLKQAQDIEYLLILHVKEKEKSLPVEKRTLTNVVNGTFSNELGQMSIEKRLKLAADTYDGMQKFVEAEKPPLFVGDQIKQYQPPTSRRMVICANCHEYKVHWGGGCCSPCYKAVSKKKGVCKGKNCTTPKDSDENVDLHSGGLCSACYYRESTGAAERKNLVCSACKQTGHMKNNKNCPKYTESYPTDAPKSKRKTPAEKKCGACGQIGHMRTNKKCPMYVKKATPSQ